MAGKRRMSRSTNKFFIRFGVYMGILLVISVLALSYISALLREYEAKQPENIAGNALTVLVNDIMTGHPEKSLTFDEIGNNKFGGQEAVFDDYVKSISGKNYTIVPGGRSYSGETLTYDVLADGEKIATMMLENSSTKTKLVVFTISDWKVTKIIPSLTVTTYSYSVTVPERFDVYVNGIGLGSDELVGSEGGNKTYELKNLISEASFRITDPDGADTYYDIANDAETGMNVVTPILFSYTLSVPEDYSVSVNGKSEQPTEKKDGTATYSVLRGAKPSIVLTDAYGTEAEFAAGGEYKTYRHTVIAPEGYTLKLGGRTIEGGVKTEAPYAKYLADYGVTVPQVTKYELTLLAENVDFEITDANGKPVKASEKNCTLDLTRLTNGENMPAELAAELDVAEIARTWSKFLTNDLTGAYYGFAQVTKYFKEGSYLYNMALNWINSENPLIVSGHVLGAFENESVTNYCKITDNCFSVDVRLVKVMYLDSGKTERDEMYSTFYFVNDGRWYLASMIDITD